MSPFHAAEVLALLTFLIGCASFHRVLGRTSSRSTSSFLPPESARSSRAPSGRVATPVPGSVAVVKSARSPNASFRVVRLRGELTLVAESEIPFKKAA
jgi:hypothetical protein